MQIIISPFSQKLRNGKENPKNYPKWKDLLVLLKNKTVYNWHDIVQIGVPGEEQLTEDFRVGLKMADLKELVKQTNFFISVENFFPHFCHHYGRSGAVIFSRSDPKIFGYPENLNLLKDKKYLRSDQYGLWESCERQEDAFLAPEEIYKEIFEYVKNF